MSCCPQDLPTVVRRSPQSAAPCTRPFLPPVATSGSAPRPAPRRGGPTHCLVDFPELAEGEPDWTEPIPEDGRLQSGADLVQGVGHDARVVERGRRGATS